MAACSSRVSEKREIHSDLVVSSEDDVSTEMPFILGLRSIFHTLSRFARSSQSCVSLEGAGCNMGRKLMEHECANLMYDHFLLGTTVSK